jgi:hypothetical protein
MEFVDALGYVALADNTTASANLRKTVGARLKKPGLRDFVVPDYLSKYIEQWIAGDFVSDLTLEMPPQSKPVQLDIAALQACVGAGFFPGIEASVTLRDKEIYAEPLRLDHSNTAKVFPGCLTEIMAVPWQADFNDCAGGIWWPSQRPDIAMLNPAQVPESKADWANPISDHQGMIDNFQRLGFIVTVTSDTETVFVEAERDPTFSRV